MWGGTDDKESIRTIECSTRSRHQFNQFRTIYGQERCEEIVGAALRQHGGRDAVVLAAKVGIDWTTGRIDGDSMRQRILQELEDPLRRLQTDYIDIYQVHWRDPLAPAQETPVTLRKLQERGKTRAIGLSNHSPEPRHIHIWSPLPRIAKRDHAYRPPLFQR
jgi:aryl-alcohol dehydrogenase-like predicted oxidoreductase